MSNVRNFIAAHSGDPKLESELKKIESMDISNIKKLDLIQAAKEKYFNSSLVDEMYLHEDPFRRDTLLEELIIGYGRGSILKND